MNGGINARLF